MNKPKQVGGTHYEVLYIQPVELFVRYNLNWFQSEVIKYISRFPNKGGLQDLYKAKHIIQLALSKIGDDLFGNIVGKLDINVEEYAKQFKKLNIQYFREPQSYYIFKDLLYDIINRQYSEAKAKMDLLIYSEYEK